MPIAKNSPTARTTAAAATTTTTITIYYYYHHHWQVKLIHVKVPSQQWEHTQLYSHDKYYHHWYN